MQAERVERELDDLRRQVRGRTESLARRFDRVLRLLEAWGYLDGWALTDAGEVLARIYHESRPAGRRGDDHRPARRPRRAVAGRRSSSCFTYEHRSRDRPPDPAVPVVRRSATGSATLERLADELQRRRGGAGPARSRAARRRVRRTWPTPGRPASGLAAVLEDEELSGGDFVRNVKQLIDLLRGIGDAAPVPATAAAARGQAADALHRGRRRRPTLGARASTDADGRGDASR